MNRVYEEFGFVPTVSGVLLVVGLVFAISFAAFRCLHSALADRLDALKDTMLSVKAAFGKEWLISREELLRIEQRTKAKEVWIISHGLQEETDKQTYLGVVRKNIKRGIKYTYVVPDNDVTRARAEQIRAAHRNSSKIVFRFIKEEFFDLVAAQDIAILGPVGEGSESMKAYMNLPVSRGGSEYFIVLSSDFAQRLVGRLMAAKGP